MFSVSGLYSGLDVNSMVNALVNAERAPIESRLNRNEQSYTLELTAVGQLKSSLSSFQSSLQRLNSIENFSQRAASVSDDSVITASVNNASVNNASVNNASVNNSAVAGSYTFTVDQLASRHQLASEGVADSETIGTGTASFTVNGETFSVALASGDDTLTGLRDAINNAEDNTTIKAAIINDNGQQRLMLNSLESGTDNAVSMDLSGLTGGTVSLGTFTELQPAQNASIRFGSGASAITISSPDNKLEDVIDGVTLDLKAVSVSPITLDISQDKGSVSSAIQSFADTWNSLKSTFSDLTGYNGVSAGTLNGDAQTRLLESQLRRELSNLFGESGDPFRSLGDLGLETTQTGDLTVNSSKLDAALSENFDALADIFAGEDGLMTRLEERLTPYLEGGGSIAQREDRLNESLSDIADDRLDLEARLVRTQSFYQQQFLAMENLLASLSGTSQWLTNNLASLNSSNNQ
ncbi:flagellar filament capping protein FliD [Endozoicomonas ascidiicola]|uniref:flagellar filament capping protein FliD n=1 Tax=Endozoicomonas ascidiicola TaxID=1698521 RepID=UPI0008337FD6|nr:flagellar filament capping protein FliD [Endozoicomonas ascidiicola]